MSGQRACAGRRASFGPRADARPALGGMAGDVTHVVARLFRQLAALGHPVLHPPGTRVVCRGGETDVAELTEQLTEEFGRHRQRMQRIERIFQAVRARHARHELRDALRAGRAHHVGFEAALLLDQVGKERHRQVVLGRHRGGVTAQRIAAGRVSCGVRRRHDDRLGDRLARQVTVLTVEPHGVERRTRQRVPAMADAIGKRGLGRCKRGGRQIICRVGCRESPRFGGHKRKE